MWMRTIPILLAIFSASGCGESLDPAIVAVRDKAVSSTKLDNARPIPDIRKGLKSDELKADSKFVVRARINAGDFPPFVDGMAAFVVTDATGHDGDESHNPHECPFCKRDINNVIAQVQFVDDSGKTIQMDARELFGVKEFDLLEVEGTGSFDESDMLEIKASRIFITR
jgi:hypothetical protein